MGEGEIMPMTLLIRGVRTGNMGMIRKRLEEQRKRREGRNFSLAHKGACLC